MAYRIMCSAKEIHNNNLNITLIIHCVHIRRKHCVQDATDQNNNTYGAMFEGKGHSDCTVMEQHTNIAYP